MEAYLAKFDFTYAEWICQRYRHGQEIPADKMHVLRDEDYQNRYQRGHEIPADKMHVLCAEDYQCRYILGHEIPDDKMYLLKDDDHRERYWYGREIPPDKMNLLTDFSHKFRYQDGHEIPPDEMHLIYDREHQCRYRYGHEILTDKMHLLDDYDYRSRYQYGGEIPADKMHLPDDYDYRTRYQHGGEIPADKMHLLSDEDYQYRYQACYDPENRPYKLSYLLGYRIPNIIKLEFTPRDHAIHHNLALNEICILALADAPFAIPREFAADVEYVTGKKVPEWLELRMPTGEVAFRIDDFGRLYQRCAEDPAAGVPINQVCDGLCSPEWGARKVGEMRGVVYLVPVVATPSAAI